MDIYLSNGYNSRKDYLNELADNHGVPTAHVFMMASMFGPNEDFDGLVSHLEDYVDQLED